MHSARSFGSNLPLFGLLCVVLYSLALVPVITVRYSYSTLTLVMSWIGCGVLLATSGVIWFMATRTQPEQALARLNRITAVGLMFGLLWVIEISINNFIAPPLPARDIIDNLFWASIAVGIFGITLVAAYQSGHIRNAVEVGTWSGFVSGAVACGMGLIIIVFRIDAIASDPLSVAEWAERGATTTVAAYFAYETFAGAFLHLIILGIMMGFILGLVGGILGKVVKRGQQLLQ